MLRADLLPEAWIAPPEVRQLRALLRHRAGLVRLGTQQRNKRGKKIATIAISRKLLTRAWHLLADMQATSTNEPPRRP